MYVQRHYYNVTDTMPQKGSIANTPCPQKTTKKLFSFGQNFVKFFTSFDNF